MKRLLTCVMMLVFCSTLTWAQTKKTEPEKNSKEIKRVVAAEEVLNATMATPDKGIPAKILSTADCLAVIPSMLQGGVGFGVRYGRGIATCRISGDHWSAPVPIRAEGGSWGLQLGGQAVDLVMVFANRDGLDQLLNSKVKLGADAGAAAGPIGRNAGAATDWKMRSKILTYSRSRGLFAGIDLTGTAVKQNTDDTLALYGDKFVPYNKILSGQVPPPKGTQPFLREVAKYFHEAKTGNVTANKNAPPNGTNATPATAAGVTGTATAAGNSNRAGETGNTGNVGAATGSSGQSDTTTTTRETTSSTNGGAQSNASSEQVKSSIQDGLRNAQDIQASNVGVDVTPDAVVLSGSVASQNAKDSARRIAQENAEGRKVIDDNLHVNQR